MKGKRGVNANLFRDFGESERGATLQIDVVAVREGRECAERIASEEVGLGSIYAKRNEGAREWAERVVVIVGGRR